MKVVFVDDTLGVKGGVTRYILDAASLLHHHGHCCVMLSLGNGAVGNLDCSWPAYRIENGADMETQIERILASECPDVAYLHKVSSPDVVHALTRRLPTVAYVHGFDKVCPGLAKYYRRGDRVCNRPFGIACFIVNYVYRCSSAHNPLTFYHMMERTRRLKCAFTRVDWFLVASPYMRRLLAQNGFDVQRISLLAPHFIQEGHSLADPPAQRSRTVLFAGRLEIEKGFPYLLRAFSRLSTSSANLLVAGDGTMRPAYQEMVSRMELTDRVLFVGWLDGEEMVRAYEECCLVVMPTVCPETFGKVGVEALTHGRPVVSFNVGGVSEWLEHGKNGYLVEPTDVPDLANRIDELLTNEAHRSEMGCLGRQMVTTRYAARDHLVRLLDALEAAMSHHG